MDFGKRLRQERERLEWTQVKMAEEGAVSKRSQIDYEQDKIEMKAAYLAALAKAGVDIVYVLTGTHGASGEVSEQEAFLLKVFRRLDIYAKQSLVILFERLATLKYSEIKRSNERA